MPNQYARYQQTNQLSTALLIILTPIALYLDLMIFQNNVGELSVTEILQELFVFDCLLLFAMSAYKKPSSRGLYILISGFFTCILIRELDQLFDLIWHGFWLVPALTVALSTIGYSLLKHNRTIWHPMVRFTQSEQFRPLIFGLIVLMIVSRILGSGHLFWDPLLGPSTGFFVKTIIQEGLELVGYTLIVHASYSHYRSLNLK